MSKAIFKLTSRGIGHVLTTGEPVFIKDISDDGTLALVIRPVVTQNGIEYREEEFATEQLESPHAQVKRKLEFDEFVRDLQEKLQEKRYALSTMQKAALKGGAFNG